MERILPNLAHLSHGMLLCFFLLMSIELYKRKEKSRLLHLLWLEMVFWLLVELKDLVYLHEPWWHDPRVATINLTIDMWGIPATMLLMFEVLSPGWARPWRIVASVAPFMLFTGLFVAKPLLKLPGQLFKALPVGRRIVPLFHFDPAVSHVESHHHQIVVNTPARHSGAIQIHFLVNQLGRVPVELLVLTVDRQLIGIVGHCQRYNHFFVVMFHTSSLSVQ